MRGILLAVVVVGLGACAFNGPPNVGIATLDSFPTQDSVRLTMRLREAQEVVSGTIVKVERQETYEDLCSVLCHIKGGTEPPRFFYAKVVRDSALTQAKDGTLVRGGDQWIGWGVQPGDWMPGKGLAGLFLLRKHCWEDFGKERAARVQAGSYQACDTMWSLAALDDVVAPQWWEFVVRNRRVLGTQADQ